MHYADRADWQSQAAGAMLGRIHASLDVDAGIMAVRRDTRDRQASFLSLQKHPACQQHPVVLVSEEPTGKGKKKEFSK